MQQSRFKFIASLFGLGALSKTVKAQDPQAEPALTRSDIRMMIDNESSSRMWQSHPFQNDGKCPTCRADNRKYDEAVGGSVPGTPDEELIVGGFVLSICQHCGTVYKPQAKSDN